MRSAIWMFFLIVVLYFFFHMMGWIGSLTSFLATIPGWGYFIIAGIIFSGYKAVEGVLEDKRADYEHIEREGQVFLERIEEERKRKKEVQ